MVPGSSWGESVTLVTVSTAAKLLMSWPGVVQGLCKLLTSGVELTAVVSVVWLQTTRLPLVVTRFDASPACALGTVRGTVVVATFPPSELAAMRVPPPAPPSPSSAGRSWASVVAPATNAQALECVMSSEDPSEGCDGYDVVARYADALLAPFTAELLSMVVKVFRPLSLLVARATSLLELAEVSNGDKGSIQASLQGPCFSDSDTHGSMLTALAPLVAKDGDQGVEGSMATECSVAISTTGEVRDVAEGCALATESEGTLHDFAELLTGLTPIIQGLCRLVNAKKIKKVNQRISAPLGDNPAGC
ncbi:unnamed protein product [Triticum aestivum]|uniref:START domain-containing protein n=2 Tax=Triticum aestivum TaxID=4565 RepID=A0A7H4LEN5_WHEAT|nr:unnamed protein product [Triticum aestivum]